MTARRQIASYHNPRDAISKTDRCFTKIEIKPQLEVENGNVINKRNTAYEVSLRRLTAAKGSILKTLFAIASLYV